MESTLGQIKEIQVGHDSLAAVYEVPNPHDGTTLVLRCTFGLIRGPVSFDSPREALATIVERIHSGIEAGLTEVAAGDLC